MAMRWLRIFNQLILTLLEARRFNTSPPAAVLIREDSLCPPLAQMHPRSLFCIRHARSERLDRGTARLSREWERCHKEKEEESEGERAAGKSPAVAGEGAVLKTTPRKFYWKTTFQ